MGCSQSSGGVVSQVGCGRSSVCVVGQVGCGQSSVIGWSIGGGSV